MAQMTVTVLSQADCQRLHEATLRILAETGVDVRHEPSLERFAAAGAKVDGRRVRIPADLVERALASAPREWPLKARDGRTTLTLRDGEVYFGTGSDCIWLRDPDTGERRRPKLADIEGLAAVCEALPNVDFVMSMGVPTDVPQEIDDISQVVALLRGTRKPLLMALRTGEAVPAMQQMAELCGARDSLAVYAMPSPPLQHDADALTKIIACAELQIPLIYAPSITAGTNAPRSLAAGMVIGNAEVLSGLVLHQQVRPGAPFVFSGGASPFDMRNVVDSYFVPEGSVGLQMACDLARYYGLPSFGYVGVSDSKCLDEQWSAEAAVTTVLGALNRATLVHDLGYLESGLQYSYESLVFSDEMVGYARAVLREVPMDDYALALEEIQAAGPGGNHLGTKYTRRHGRDFWLPGLLSRIGYDRWAADGSRTLLERVRARVAELRAREREQFVSPETDAAILELMEQTGRQRVAAAAT